jgi:excisionase family DNA binding protein
MESPRLRTIPSAQEELGVGRSTLYRLIGEGEVETVKIGSRCLVVSASIDAYVDRLRANAALSEAS